MEAYIYSIGMNICISIMLLCMLYTILELLRWRD
jgi:hypothetical protein